MDIIIGKAELTVEEKHLAVNIGSGSVKVLATPVMIALMEKAAAESLVPLLKTEETSVGTEISITHISATPETMRVFAFSKVTNIEGRVYSFDIEAYDETGLIGKGTHKRAVLNEDRFILGTQKKLSSDARKVPSNPFIG